MNVIKLIANGNKLDISESKFMTSGNVNTVTCRFVFDEGWDGLQKTAVLYQSANNMKHVALNAQGECVVPEEVLSQKGMLYIGVFGSSAQQGETVLRKTTNFARKWIDEGSFVPGTLPEAPAEDVYAQILDIMRAQAADAQAAREASDDAQAALSAAEAERLLVEQTAASVAADAGRAYQSSVDAAESQTLAKQDKDTVAQTMTDFLAMLGSDVATLTGGKLTPSQIPAIAVTDTFLAGSEEAMLDLDAQTGDICIRTDESKSYILKGGDAAELSHWLHLVSPSNFADTAGYAAAAGEAQNAARINNKRIVSMTQTQYDTAVLDDDTYYFVLPDPEV